MRFSVLFCFVLSCHARFVETCLQLAKEGLNDEEAIEKATNTLEFHKMTRGVHLDQVCIYVMCQDFL